MEASDGFGEVTATGARFSLLATLTEEASSGAEANIFETGPILSKKDCFGGAVGAGSGMGAGIGGVMETATAGISTSFPAFSGAFDASWTGA